MIIRQCIAAFCFVFMPLAFGQSSIHGCYTYWPPYTYVINDEPFGISADIIKAAAKQAKLELTLTQLPWKRCLVLVENGKMDFAMDGVARVEYIQGRFPTALYSLAFWTREDDPMTEYKGLDTLADYRLGLYHAYAFPDEINAATFATVEWLDTEETVAKMINADRLDLTLADTVVMRGSLKKLDQKLKMLKPLYRIQKLKPLFKEPNRALMEQLDTALGQLYQSGVVDQIYMKYTESNFTEFYQLESDFQPAD